MLTIIPSQQKSPIWGLFVCRSNTIELSSMDAVREESSISPSLPFLQEKATGGGGGMESQHDKLTCWFTCLLHVPCPCNPYPAVPTNSAVSPKQTTKQMSNTIHYKCLKAEEKKILKCKVFNSILQSWMYRYSLISFYK